jgi:putative tricarboxylic transport membrane protein
MRLSDRLAGVLILAFGLAIAGYALATFPPMPGQEVGPSLFPTVIGAGFALFGATLTLTGLRGESGPLLVVDEWVRHHRLRRNFAVVVGGLLFYAAAVDLLGFFITAILFLSALFLAFGVARRRILPLAILVTLVIHYGFYTLLRVPLPWGVLGGLAW